MRNKTLVAQEAKIDVLVAVYNGGKFLGDFLESLRLQTCSNFRILFSDDKSSDGSGKKFEKICREKKLDFVNVSTAEGFGSSKKNFEHLLACSTAQYVMLADQDDYWEDFKIQKTYDYMKSMDGLNGGNLPCMVFTDLKVVDSNLNIIHESMIKAKRYDPGIAQQPKRLACQNVIAGCTVFLNRAAVKQVIPFTEENVVHDHWIGLVVANRGRVGFLDEATILYRQHSGNQIGVDGFDLRVLLKKMFKMYSHIGIYKRAAKNAGINVTFVELAAIKVWLNLKRVFG